MPSFLRSSLPAEALRQRCVIHLWLQRLQWAEILHNAADNRRRWGITVDGRRHEARFDQR